MYNNSSEYLQYGAENHQTDTLEEIVKSLIEQERANLEIIDADWDDNPELLRYGVEEGVINYLVELHDFDDNGTIDLLRIAREVTEPTFNWSFGYLLDLYTYHTLPSTEYTFFKLRSEYDGPINNMLEGDSQDLIGSIGEKETINILDYISDLNDIQNPQNIIDNIEERTKDKN
jgi:hypothetical protein